MREILFRGKRIDNGEWVEGYLIHDEFCNTFIPYIGYLYGDGVDIAEVDPETVGQYTGMRDCTRTKEYPNGKRIFEGDIVKGSNVLHENRKIYQVIYDDNGFYFFDEDGEGWHPYNIDDVEVIGNFYDNPELLEADHDSPQKV